jgi:prepilin-type N-terminal cleavage/methylation domain-containing protein
MLIPREARRGFTIAEMVVSVAILAILASVIVPSGSRYIYQTRLQDDADLLDSITRGRIAMRNAATAVLFIPGRMSDLSSEITTKDSTSCNGTNGQVAVLYSSAAVNSWTNAVFVSPTPPAHAGPYFGRIIPETGLRLSFGTAQDKMVRLPTINSTYGFQNIIIPAVTYADARAFNAIVDGADLPGPNRTDTAGTVRWSTTPSGPSDTVTMRWYMAIPSGFSCS